MENLFDFFYAQGALRVIPAETRLTVYRRSPVLKRRSKSVHGVKEIVKN